MDQAELRGLVAAAVEGGMCPPELLDAMQNVTSIEVGEVSRSNLLHMYRRRLRRTERGSPLQEQTAALVDFLTARSEEMFNMVSVRLEAGGYQLLPPTSAQREFSTGCGCSRGSPGTRSSSIRQAEGARGCFSPSCRPHRSGVSIEPRPADAREIEAVADQPPSCGGLHRVDLSRCDRGGGLFGLPCRHAEGRGAVLRVRIRVRTGSRVVVG